MSRPLGATKTVVGPGAVYTGSRPRCRRSTSRPRSPRSGRTARRRSCRTAGCGATAASSTAARARCSSPSRPCASATPRRCRRPLGEDRDPALLPGPRVPGGLADPRPDHRAGRRPARVGLRRRRARRARRRCRSPALRATRRGSCCRSSQGGRADPAPALPGPARRALPAVRALREPLKRVRVRRASPRYSRSSWSQSLSR